MKFTTYFLMFFLYVSVNSHVYAETNMRCGSKLISVGNTKAEVLLKCGEPMLKESVGQKEDSKRIDIPLTSETDTVENGPSGNSRDIAIVRSRESVTKNIDQWTYNQGTGKFLKILIFEGGELVAIDNGDRV